MDNTHTPGPWRTFGRLVWGPDALPGHDSDAVECRELVAEVASHTNARLIAAAPDLLKALTFTLSMAIGHAADARGISPAECEDFGWAKDARAVIAKAKGD